MYKIIPVIIVLTMLGVYGFAITGEAPENTPEQNLGAFGDPFVSVQLATSPSNGDCLLTDGTDNSWGACSADSFSTTTNTYWAENSLQLGQVSDVSTTSLATGYVLKWSGTAWESVATSTLNITATALLTPWTSDIDADGYNLSDLGDVTFKTGAAGGTLRTGVSAADKFTLQAYDVNGGAYTTLLEADAGNDPYLQVFTDTFFFENRADPTKQARLDLSGLTTGNARTLTVQDSDGTIAYTSDIDNASSTNLSVTGMTDLATLRVSGLSTLANATSTLISGTSAWYTNFYGALSGNASTATALGANGANCSAGSFPLGVDASGAVESCTDAWTESENTSAGYQTVAQVYSIVGATTSLPNLATLAGLTSIGTNGATTTAEGNFASDTFGIVGKFFASATQFWVAVAGYFNAGLTVLTFLDIPSSTNPTVDAEGELAVNTTQASSTLRFHDGTAERSASDRYQKTLKISSSTVLSLGGVNTGTTTILLDRAMVSPITHLSRYCETTTGTHYYRIGDGTASSSAVACTTSGVSETITNGTFQLNDKIYLEVGPITGATSSTIIIGQRYDAD